MSWNSDREDKGPREPDWRIIVIFIVVLTVILLILSQT
jgi:hypothetical protein